MCHRIRDFRGSRESVDSTASGAGGRQRNPSGTPLCRADNESVGWWSVSGAGGRQRNPSL